MTGSGSGAVSADRRVPIALKLVTNRLWRHLVSSGLADQAVESSSDEGDRRTAAMDGRLD